jgi:uncharacterized Zn finger protein (UPF0148 family)
MNKETKCNECNSTLININGKLECQYCGGNNDYIVVIEEDENNEN